MDKKVIASTLTNAANLILLFACNGDLILPL